MRRIRNFVWLLIVVGLAFADPRDYVLLVSFDGFRADYLHQTATPNFDRLAEAGVMSDGMQPCFVTKTFPNHYSLATGMYVENHGLIANYFYDRKLKATFSINNRTAVGEARWYGGEPIWVTAERQGLKSACFYWVGSEAPIRGIRPTIWKKYDHTFPYAARVDSVLAWFRRPEPSRPRLVLLYFPEPDETGHAYGPEAPETLSKVRDLDAVLGRLLDGIQTLDIYPQLNIIVVSDHGMAAISPERTLNLADYTDMTAVRQENSGPFTGLYGVSKRRLKQIRKDLRKVEHLQVYHKRRIPRRWHYRDHHRIKDLLVVADEGWSILDYKKPDPQRYQGGTHGYDNACRSMQAIFLADGPAFKDGYRLDSFENIHIYPLIAHILDLRPYHGIDGDLDQVEDLLRE